MQGTNHGTPTQSITSNKYKYKVMSKVMSYECATVKQNCDLVVKSTEFKS